MEESQWILKRNGRSWETERDRSGDREAADGGPGGMKRSNVLDTFKLVFTAMAATAAVVVALDQIRTDRRCVMFERYEQVSENFRMERTWWIVLKYGVGPSLLGIVLTRGRVLALDTLTG